MSNKDRLLALCINALDGKGINKEPFRSRLKEEIKDLNAQNEYDYFIELYDNKVYKEENPNNTIVPYLLGITNQFNIEEPPAYDYGDFPDIDIDFLPAVQSYLKQTWAPKTFGSDCVANIGNYNTFGIKSALQDGARVFDNSRTEIISITKAIPLKDGDGKPVTWEKALEVSEEFQKYCDENPELADSARRLVNRNRSMGKHAGGLIISSMAIDKFVPLVKDKEGTPLSSWVEGLSGQDLGPMGLIKFDLLVITNLMQIALACSLIKERYGEEAICALPGQDDWSDTSYLDDPTAIRIANAADLRCIFQFDSDGIRSLVKSGGVDCFEDLVAYTALYRPGPMGEKMHDLYVRRKKGESYELHPLLKPVLGTTYGIMIYQEQCMRVLNVVGDIPLKFCEIVRKAISKKKVDLFIEYKEQFVENGQKNLGWPEEQVVELWNQIEAFAGYGFNLSHATAYTYISSRLLWLKAHYPLEFFAAILSCENSSDKIKEYMNEAKEHGLDIRPPDINKSSLKFKIVDDDPKNPSKNSPIYFGFSNIKGIGDAVSERIVESQPYNGFIDYLERFGTDLSAVKPLLGLSVFGGDPIDQYKYYEHYKSYVKKRADRDKRFQKTCGVRIKSLMSLFPEDFWKMENSIVEEEIDFSDKFFTKLENQIDSWNAQNENLLLLEDELTDIRKKHRRAIATFENKVQSDEPVDSLFNPDEIDVPPSIIKLYSDDEELEKAFYGFLWTHPLEKCEKYKGFTYEAGRNSEVEVACWHEVRVLSYEKKMSRNGNPYYLLKAEDAHSEVNFIQVWDKDWDRFEDEFSVDGAMLKLKLDLPSGGYNRYTFHSPPKHRRWELPPKDADNRLIVMR